MSDQKTSGDSRSATSSQELQDGHSPCSSPESLMTSPSGRVVLRASLLAWLEEAKARKTTVTWLRPFSISSQSVVLQACLASRLQQLSKRTSGLMLYSRSWKKKDTPAGRTYFQLQAGALHTNATDYFSALFGWTMPSHSDGRRGGSGITPGMSGSSLAQQVKMANWSSPCAQNGTVNGYKDWRKVIKRKENGRQQNLQDVVVLTNWPTSSATDGKGGYQGGRIRNGKLSVDRLDVAAQLATPDYPIRITADGIVLTGSIAGMSVSGQLNPEHSRWLMGYPGAWGYSKDMVTPSFHKSPLGSSVALSSQLMRLAEALFRNRIAREANEV